MSKTKKDLITSFLFIGDTLRQLIREHYQDDVTKKSTKHHNTQIILINNAESLRKGLVSFIQQAKAVIATEAHSKIQIIIYTHGVEDGKTIKLGKSDADRNQFLRALSSNEDIKNADVDVYQFSCYAGAGLIRTSKNNEESKTETSQDSEGNYNQDELMNSLPKNWQFTVGAGKYPTLAVINEDSIDNLIQNHQKSPLIKKVQLMLYPQTFKWFKKKADGTSVFFKYDAPKPEKLAEKFLTQIPPLPYEELYKLISESYKNYIKSKIDEFREVYIASNEVPDVELVQTEIIKNQIDSNPKLISDYINMDFLIAAGECKLERVALYINNSKAFNFDINADILGQSFLNITCELANLDVIKMLLAADGIDVNKLDSSGATPLHSAISKGNLEVVRELLGNTKIDVNKPNSSGKTPLHIACSHKEVGVVKELLSVEGIRINERDSFGCTPLQLACMEGRIEIIEALLPKLGGVEVKDLDLVNFVINNKLELLQRLVSEHGANVNQERDGGKNLLHMALQFTASVEMVNFLLNNMSSAIINKKADGERSDDYANGNSAIEYALQQSLFNGNVEKFTTILNHPKVEIDKTIVNNFNRMLKLKHKISPESKAEILQLIQDKLKAGKGHETDEEEIPSETTKPAGKASTLLKMFTREMFR